MDTNDQYDGHPPHPWAGPARLPPGPAGRGGRRRRRARTQRRVRHPLTQAHAADGDDDNTVLTVAVAQSVDSLSPFLAVRLLSTSIHRLTYEYLTNYDPEDNHVVPGLATSWESPRTS